MEFGSGLLVLRLIWKEIQVHVHMRPVLKGQSGEFAFLSPDDCGVGARLSQWAARDRVYESVAFGAGQQQGC